MWVWPWIEINVIKNGHYVKCGVKYTHTHTHLKVWMKSINENGGLLGRHSFGVETKCLDHPYYS